MSRLLKAAVGLLALTLLFVQAPTAQGYVIIKTWKGMNKHWSGATVPWTLENQGISNLTNDQFKEALQDAFDSWEAVGCATIDFTANGVKNGDPGNSIHATVNTNSWDPTVGEALAYAVTDNNGNGVISSADIVFNAVESEWTISTNAPPGFNDVQGVMTHEIGHAIGIDHSRHFEATMFFSGGSSDLRSLETDDKNAACYLYPAVDFDDGQACDTCHNSSHCANGYCLDFGGGNGFCGSTCANSNDCDEGFTCTSIQGGSNQCLPDNGYCDQYGSNIGLGGFCYGHATCSSGICLVLPDEAYCSKQCTSSCQNGFACVNGFCLKAGTKDYGDPCELSSECETGTCINFTAQGVCTMACGNNGGGSCPNGDQCLQDIYCAPPGPGANGSPCYIGTQCQGTWCVDSKCTEPCSNSSTCPDGTTCASGWCVGAEIGGGCTSDAQCPDGLACLLAGDGSSGTCVQACNPLMENVCFEGEACVWAWQDWNETITGSCQPKIGGGAEGDTCSAADPCELDLVCAEGVYGEMVCHRDCKIYANALGCSAGHKCLSLDLPDDPKKGYCVLKNPPPPPVEPEDVGSPDPPDAGPAQDTTGAPDTAIGPSDDVTGPPTTEPDGGAPFVDGSGSVNLPGPSEPTTVSGSQSNSSGGGCGSAPSGTPWLLPALMFVLWALRRRPRRSLSRS
ncbi:MAG: hypothetical protein CL940_06410 [Deltaproteobacteria bacterium]|nr:hypothetical protein [Deltaproteobacteria bacterium]